ncbi:hypothetical protein D0Y65_022228 [Glycine soja]|uniref:Aminotransferase-like plant mobile domain-containing protein n=1 Tax=Glycine soja TaxID=3848 RepID=A0A445JMX5_GLYSO|nr:hypothetical protein D0Y65_022228 [Glycine soja]
MPSTFHVIFWNTNISNSNHEKIPLEVRYNGWHYPHENWKAWVKQMHHKYEHVWIEAGIDQAIKASTFQIRRNDELILELAQRWCSKTNTFVFPCGEATITLEDMKGRSYATDEHFMSNESRVEHEGFLSLWLSRFVFPPKSYNAISKNVFPIAVHLARGSKIALAPAVLAGISRDLRLLNNKIRTATKVEVGVKLWTPFQLAQVWALERFPLLHSRLPHGIRQGKLMVAKWHKVKMLKHDSFKLILDSLRARNGFIWRPYKNSPPLELYNEKDMWACNNPNYFDELESFARCLRVSVGMECVEQCWKWRGFVYSPLYVVSPSSRVEGARSVNGNDNGVKIKNSSCDTDDVRDKEGEDASHRIVGIASNFESRIEKLERVIAKLEAAKNGQRVQNTGVKAKPSAP